MDKITPKDIYKCLWICRDFEVDHLWQRSVFLGGFLLACFAAYGAVASTVLFRENGTHMAAAELVNAVGFGICLVGIVLSLLWLMMAKGSKAWYERYEQAIEAFAKSYSDQFDGGMSRLDGSNWEKIPRYKTPPRSNWLSNPKGGEYSPSKINYGLGIVSFIIWLVLAAAHIILASEGCKSPRDIHWLTAMLANWKILAAIGVIVFVGTLLWGSVGLRSGFLSKKKGR